MRGNKADQYKKKSGNVIWTLLLMVAIIVFCYSAYHLIKLSLEYRKGANEYSALEKYAKTDERSMEAEAQSEAGEEAEPVLIENPIDFTELKAINEEIIGWLRVEAIDISYPIAQTTDNEYYLHNTFEKKPVFAGCIFVDYRNKKDFSDRNTLIYGHNMKDGSMFGRLNHFYDVETYRSNPYFWIYASDKILKYEIFSCQEVGAVSDSYQISFQDDQEFAEYLEKAKAQSVVSNEVEVGVQDQIATLSTCTGDEATRFIVQGKLVKSWQTK